MSDDATIREDIETIIEIASGWTRPMSDKERLRMIGDRATVALARLAAPAAEAERLREARVKADWWLAQDSRWRQAVGGSYADWFAAELLAAPPAERQP